MTTPIIRSRRARILEKAGLRYVAAWLPTELAESLDPEIAAAAIIATNALAKVRAAARPTKSGGKTRKRVNPSPATRGSC